MSAPLTRCRHVAGLRPVCLDWASSSPPSFGTGGVFLREVSLPDLRATHQNVHLTGVGLFEPHQPAHEHLVHPLHYANQVVACRNRNQRPGHASATVSKVIAHRGLPSSDVDARAYGRNLAQKAQWERDPRVTVIHRPLRYRYQRDALGRKATDEQGRWLTIGKPQEKGIDVLCALALVREARDSSTDLVILCSQDTDLEPALDEAFALGSAKVETASWFDPKSPYASREIHPARGTRIWNTRLNDTAFAACRDSHRYP